MDYRPPIDKACFNVRLPVRMKRCSRPRAARSWVRLGSLAFTYAVGVMLSGAWALNGWAANPPAKLNIDDSALTPEVKARTSVAPIAKKAAASVVNIYSTMTIRDRPNPLLDDPFLRRFFGEEFGQQQPRQREHKAESLGSGVIVSSDGYILTANHVIEGADKIKVALASGEREYDAKVIGADPPTDIAVLKVNLKTNLPALPITDSDKLEVGDMVMAIGNPFGVGQTVTMGIVSGLGRGGFEANAYENFIQTDAAINPGNSGGALVDAEGRLVGVNTIILSRSGGFMGVGFAVPANMARYVMDRLIESGRVTRGFLGINIQPLTPELAKEFYLPDESSGVLVGGVTPNSAAATAGVQDGDVIIALNGKKVTDPRNLQLLVAQTPPGTPVQLQVLRGGPGQKPVEKTLSAKLGELPQEKMTSRGNTPETPSSSNMDALDGVSVSDVDSAARRRFGIPGNVRGALVVNVEPDSNAAEAHLQPGDVIMEINRQSVRNADAAVTLSDKVKGNRVLLRVWSRGENGGPGGTRYLVVENAKNKP
jgi:serine protease Do